MGTQIELAVPGRQRLAADRAWVHGAGRAGYRHGGLGSSSLPCSACDRPGCRRYGCPPWAGYQRWYTCWCCSTLAQRGAFAPAGINAALAPLSTVIWILAMAATLHRSW